MGVKSGFAAFLLITVVIWLLAGCASLNGARQPTLPPTELVPTWIAQTVAARAQTEAAALGAEAPPTLTSSPPSGEDSQEPAQAASATLSFLGPSPTPSDTPTPTTTSMPLLPTRTPTPLPTAGIPGAAIQISIPGPLSRIISPLQLRANVRPGLDGKVRVELLGEDGRLLVRKIFNYGEAQGYVYVADALEFEISAAAETARLVVSTYDTFGRLYALQSVEVILLSIGEDDLNPPGSDLEAVLVLEPLPNKLIQGGMLQVKGLARLSSEQPLLIELITAQGKVVGYRQGAVSVDPEGVYMPFSVEVPYTVNTPTWVRVVIRQENGGRIPGVVYATSLEVLLSP